MVGRYSFGLLNDEVPVGYHILGFEEVSFSFSFLFFFFSFFIQRAKSLYLSTG